MKWIENTQALEDFCQTLQKESVIAVDTEFVRVRTYHAQLGIIQVNAGGKCALIDPLAPGLDLCPLKALLYNPNILKVFHAPHQDLEIFYHLWQEVPKPLMDTQLLAMFAGFGENISYQALCEQLLGVSLNKKMRFRNWQKRPLSTEEKEYAALDVVHLYDVYFLLKEMTAHKYAWAEEDIATLYPPQLFQIDYQKIWKRFKKPSVRPTLEELGALYHLVAWREEMAQKTDKLPKNVVSDEILHKVVEILHGKGDESLSTCMQKEPMLKKHINAIKEVVGKSHETSPDFCKNLLWGDKGMAKNDTEKLKQLKERLSLEAANLGIPLCLLARTQDMQGILRQEKTRLHVGWREEVLRRVDL